MEVTNHSSFYFYKTRHLVYSYKRVLKDNPTGIFITENLAEFRSGLTMRLAKLKHDRQISTYCTIDGRIFVKLHETSPKMIVREHHDIDNLERLIAARQSNVRPSTLLHNTFWAHLLSKLKNVNITESVKINSLFVCFSPLYRQFFNANINTVSLFLSSILNSLT